jgi:hypothetical protein
MRMRIRRTLRDVRTRANVCTYVADIAPVGSSMPPVAKVPHFLSVLHACREVGFFVSFSGRHTTGMANLRTATQRVHIHAPTNIQNETKATHAPKRVDRQSNNTPASKAGVPLPNSTAKQFSQFGFFCKHFANQKHCFLSLATLLYQNDCGNSLQTRSVQQVG